MGTAPVPRFTAGSTALKHEHDHQTNNNFPFSRTNSITIMCQEKTNTMQEVVEMMGTAGPFSLPIKLGSRFSFAGPASVSFIKFEETGTSATLSPADDLTITLISQDFQILLTPREGSSKTEPAKRKAWVPPIYDVEPKEEARVVAMRTEQLVGKTVTGSYFVTGNNRTKHWIRWNNKKCDNIYVHKHVIEAVLGPEPKLGTRLRTKITELGPETATAWRMHPQCTAVEVVPKTSYFSQSPSSGSEASFGGRTHGKIISLCSSRARTPSSDSNPSTPVRPRFINTRADMSMSWRTRSVETMEG